MTFKQLETLVKQGESETLEFKSTTGGLKDAMATVCAFLNSKHGGTVIFGVKDDGTIVGQEVNDGNLKVLAGELKRIEPFSNIDVQYIELDTKKKVIVVPVNPGSKAPYMYDGRHYIRIQSTTSRMLPEQLQYLYHKNNPKAWETFTNNNCTINDLDKERIKETVRLGIEQGRITSIALQASIPAILEKLELMVDGKLTNAAVVLFCKKESKQFIQSSLKFARFNGLDKSSFHDQKNIRANAFDLYDKSMDFLYFHLPIAARIEPGKSERVETPAIPFSVLREAVTNALVHRNYSDIGGSISIARYDDRVEITNTGALLADLSVDQLKKKHNSVLRNPLIANVFFIAGKIEKWGRGTIDMIKDCKNVGNPLPIYEEMANNFSVTLPLREPIQSFIFEKQESKLIINLTKRQHSILEILKFGPLNRQQLMDKLKLDVTIRTIQRDLSLLKRDKLIKSNGESKAMLWSLV